MRFDAHEKSVIGLQVRDLKISTNGPQHTKITEDQILILQLKKNLTKTKVPLYI